MFINIITDELEANIRYDPKRPDPLRNPSYIAKIVTTRYVLYATCSKAAYHLAPTRIHNQYMLTSAWKIVRDVLRELVHRGMTNKNVKALLKNDMRIRSLYLALVHMIEVTIDIYQQRFSVLALNSGMLY